MQVTLDPAARRVGALDQAGARRAKLLNAGSQLRIEPLVLQDEGGGAAAGGDAITKEAAQERERRDGERARPRWRRASCPAFEPEWLN